MIVDKIDLVIPYVDSLNAEWQKLYLEYRVSINHSSETDGVQRFRSAGDLFKYFFRCLEKNAPWLNNIYFLVQSLDQVPGWLNKDRVKIVLHSDFIPVDFLPTFNSTCIEMFLWNIPGLSEHFIYANDDTYVINQIQPSDFFTRDGKTKGLAYIHTGVGSMFDHHIVNSYCEVYGVSEKEKERMSAMYGKCMAFKHTLRPYLKSIMKKCYEKHRQHILESISKFREIKNFNVYLYDNYLKGCGYQDVITDAHSKMIHSGASREYELAILCNTYYKIVCIEDTRDDIDIYKDQTLKDFFKEKFFDKSNYEL